MSKNPKREEKVPIKAEGKGTAITPWRPEDYMANVDRTIDDFERRFGNAWPFGSAWFGPRRRWLAPFPEVRRPYADLVDSGKDYRVMAEVPGIPKDKLDVTVSEREIRIEGEAKTDIHEDREGFVRRERSYSKISRLVSFPEPVVADKAEATLNNGVLEVRVPKQRPTRVARHKVVVK